MRQLALFEEGWAVARSKERRQNRTIFAQRRLRPEDVLPEWHKSLARASADATTSSASRTAPSRASDQASKPSRRGFKAPTASLPEEVRERLDAEGLTGTLARRLSLSSPAAGCVRSCEATRSSRCSPRRSSNESLSDDEDRQLSSRSSGASGAGCRTQ
jgi:hypothetical protein